MDSADKAKLRKRSSDKRKKVELTSGERRLLNDLVWFEDYLGQAADNDALNSADDAGLVEIVGRNKVGRPYVRPTKKGLRHQAQQGDGPKPFSK